MHAIPAVAFLAAAAFCSVVSRVLLIKTAFGVSKVWGFIVLLVPFGPLFFRLKYRELAYPTRHWRLAIVPLMGLYVLSGGSMNSIRSMLDAHKPATTTEASAGDTHFHLPVSGKAVAAALGTASEITETGEPASAPASTAPAKPSTTPAPAAKPVAASSPATPVPTPSPAVAAASAAMAPAPQVLDGDDRVAANRREFARLAEWYDNLKHQRGYLRKNDTVGIEAFNAEAAKYQAALQLAKTEEAALAKLTAKK